MKKIINTVLSFVKKTPKLFLVYLLCFMTLASCVSNGENSNTPSYTTNSDGSISMSVEDFMSMYGSDSNDNHSHNEESSSDRYISVDMSSEEVSIHEHNYVEEVVEPTCEKQGYTLYKCECGDEYKDNYVEELGHTYTEKVVEPTCEEMGYTVFKCECGDTYNGNYVKPLGHSYGDWYVVSNATCVEDGLERRDCLNCDFYETKILGNGTHNYSEEIIEPTCEEMGYTLHTCECGESYKDNYVEELGHSYGDWYVVEASTCESDGLERRDCSRCEHYENNIIESLGHTHDGNYYYDEKSHWNIANCEHNGQIINVEEHNFINGLCKECGFTESTVTMLEFTLSEDGTYYILSGCNTNVENVIILDTYKGLPVKEIASYAFYNCSKLENLSIPNSIERIGTNIFDGCTSLRFNEIGNLLYIGNEDNPYLILIKAKKPSITSCELQEGLRFICENAFYECNSMIDVYYRGTIENWCNIIFSSATSNPMYYVSHFYMLDENDEYKEVTRIEIPNTVTSINYQFYGFNNVTEIIIPNSVSNIGSNAFNGCSSLISITIPDSVTSIGERAFYGCSSLTNVYYSGSIEDWCNITFSNDDSNPMYYASHFYMLDENNEYKEITRIEIPNTVTSIGDYQFWGFDNVTEIIIPSSVTSIGKRALFKCSSLESITIPFIGQNADGSGATHFGYIFGSSSYGNHSSYVPSCLKEVIITGGTSIGEKAFCDCSSLTSITIPNSVASIGYYAFSGCSSLTNVYYSGSIEYWCNITFSSSTSNPMYYASHFYMLDENNEYKEVTRIEIPDSVTSIGDYQFYGFDNVTEIIIPNNVTSIGSYAFSNCSSLESITLPFVGQYADGSGTSNFGYIFGASSYEYNNDYVPSSLKEVIITGGTSIGERAFSNCSSLTSIVIPNSVTSIGNYTFEYCSSLTNVYYLETIEDWCNITFSSSSSNPMSYASHFYILDENNEWYEVTRIEIPDTVTSIGDYQFYGFDNVTEIIIPNSVTSIGSSAFSNCSSLERITIPFVGQKKDGSGATNFGYIFGASSYSYNKDYVPSSLKEVIITGETSIGERAFSKCSSLTSIVIPNSVTSIENYAFSGCSSLTSIIIPNSITSIGSSAFSYCSSLTSIVIPNSVTSIGERAFSNCSSLITVTFEEGSQLTSIGSYAFSNCSSLTSITIPNSVTSIGEAAFYSCYFLTIYCEASSKPSGWSSSWNYSNRPVYWEINENNFIEINGIQYVIVNGEATITRYVGNDSEVVIPSSIEINGIIYNVTSIGSSAFYNCSSLTSITIPNSVTSIGECAFCNCSSLTTVIFEEGSQLTSIGLWAFSSCSSLTSITIPNSVASIGNYAFSCCSSLTSITIPNSVTSIGECAFEYCDSLTIYCEVSSQPSGWSSSWNGYSPVYWGINENNFIEINGIQYVIVNGEASITRYVGNDSEVVIPSSIEINGITYNVTSIGEYAFCCCSSLTSIEIPNSVTSIGNSAFSGCSSLTSIVIPNSVTSIGSYAFENCSSLTIYCEASSKPSGWSSSWNYSSRPVYWGITSEDIIEQNGIQYVIVNGEASITRYVGNDSEVVIPSSIEVNGTTYNVTSIGNYAFSGCSSLTSIVIPNSVTSIGNYTFSNCDSLTNVYYSGTVEDWCNITFSSANQNPMCYASHFYMLDENNGWYEVTRIEIPDTVTSIGNYQFYGFNNVTEIIIPNSVTSIGSSAFSNCSSLESITLPFVGASSTATGSSALFGYIFGTTSYIGGTATKQYCSSSSYDYVTYYIPSSLKEVVITGGTTISYGAFENCNSLKSIAIPNSVTSIGNYAFYNCSSLKTITIPNSVTSIGNYAFENCSFLIIYCEASSKPSGWSSSWNNSNRPVYWGINENTFIEKDGVQYVIVNGEATITRYVGNDSEVVIPSSIEINGITYNVTSIGERAFYNCSSLISIVIPNCVTSIGNNAFEYCYYLTIYCEASSKPSGWSSSWNPSNRPVIWGYKGN